MTFTNKKANTWSNITVLWHLLQQQKRKKNKKKIGATIGCSSDWIVQKICKYYTDRLFSHEELSKKKLSALKVPIQFLYRIQRTLNKLQMQDVNCSETQKKRQIDKKNKLKDS